MAEKEMEVVLVYTEYDMAKSKLCDAQLPLTVVLEADPLDYPVFVKAGEWSDGGELRICPHLRVKINGGYKNADIAVKMTEGQAQSIEAVTTEPKGDAYCRYEDKEEKAVYFIPPRYWEYRYGKLNETSVNHYNTIGSEEIRIHFIDGRTESMTLLSKIMDEEKDFCRELVFDLMSMDQQLCMDQKSSMYMAVQWEKDLYEETQKMTEDFCTAFRSMEKEAQPALKPFKDKKSFQKIKKMTSQALIEHEIFHKDKVAAIAYKEDLDTFEHRVVRTYLERLKNLVRVRSRMELSGLEKKRASLETDLNLGHEELESRIENVKQKLRHKEARLKAMLDADYGEQDSKESLLPVYIRFQVGNGFRGNDGKNGLMGFHIRNQERLEAQIGPWHPGTRQQITYIGFDGRTYGYKVLGKNGKWPEGWTEYSVPGARQTKRIYISVPADCTEDASMLFHYLQSDQCIVSGNDYVGIYGDIVREGYCRKGEFYFNFRKIKGITLFDSNGFQPLDKEKETYLARNLSDEERSRFREEFYEYVLHNVELPGYETEDLAFYEAVKKKKELAEELDLRLKDKEGLKEKWTALLNRLDEIGRSPLMKAVTPVRTSVDTSNLFAFHPAYQKMYGVMAAHEHKMGGIDYCPEDPDEKFQVGKLEELYEIWSCIRLLWLFVNDYGFRLAKGPDSLQEYIREALRDGGLSGTRFDLEGDVTDGTGTEKMKVTIWYEKRISIDKEYLRENHFFACDRKGKLRERASLTPDFVMRMEMGGRVRVFVLDAKYRGQGYDGIKDLCEVAFQKYTLELGNRRKWLAISGDDGFFWEEIDGSFIIHSSSDVVEKSFDHVLNGKEIEVKYHPQNYLGAFPDVLARKLWIDRCRDNGWLVSLDKLQEWADWRESGDNHENRIGIVAVNPKKDHLSNLLQMIMEHYFGLYRSRCWICGSSNIEVELKYTGNRYPKYYIRCLDCGEITVETHCRESACPSHKTNSKLGKHLTNYYAQMKGQGRDVWKNVSCPVCRATLYPQPVILPGSFQFSDLESMPLPFD